MLAEEKRRQFLSARCTDRPVGEGESSQTTEAYKDQTSSLRCQDVQLGAAWASVVCRHSGVAIKEKVALAQWKAPHNDIFVNLVSWKYNTAI